MDFRYICDLLIFILQFPSQRSCVVLNKSISFVGVSESSVVGISKSSWKLIFG